MTNIRTIRSQVSQPTSAGKGADTSEMQAHHCIGVREGIVLGGRKKFALKVTICPKNRQIAMKLTF